MTSVVPFAAIPRPRPETIERALANAIANHLTHHGWRTADELYVWHPTGNPTSHRYATGARIPQAIPNLELLRRDVYAWDIIDPTPLHPPLAYALTQLALAERLVTRSDGRELMAAAQGWLEKCRGATRNHDASTSLFRPKANRHGNSTRLRRSDAALATEAQAFLIAADAAEVVRLDEDAYDEYLESNRDEFNATAALAILERGLGVSLATVP